MGQTSIPSPPLPSREGRRGGVRQASRSVRWAADVSDGGMKEAAGVGGRTAAAGSDNDGTPPAGKRTRSSLLVPDPPILDLLLGGGGGGGVPSTGSPCDVNAASGGRGAGRGAGSRQRGGSTASGVIRNRGPTGGGGASGASNHNDEEEDAERRGLLQASELSSSSSRMGDAAPNARSIPSSAVPPQGIGGVRVSSWARGVLARSSGAAR